MMKLGIAALCVAGCSSSATTCPGAPPAKALVEAFCKAGEADRCFYDQSPLDGF